MNEPLTSPMDILLSGQENEIRPLIAENSGLTASLRDIIDKGLPPDEFKVFQGLKEAAEAALAIAESALP